jgi:hypothetical protein
MFADTSCVPTKGDAMPAMVAIFLLVALLFGGSARAEDKAAVPSAPSRVYGGAYGKPVSAPIGGTVSTNRIGIVVKSDAVADATKKLLSERNYVVEEELPGGVMIVRLPKEHSRAEILDLTHDLTTKNANLIRRAGLLATLPGSTRPVIVLEQIIVRYKTGASPERISQVVSENKLEATLNSILEQKGLEKNPQSETYAPANQSLYRAADPTAPLDALETSKNISRLKDIVEFAHPNVVIPLELRDFPADMSLEQWHHRNTGQDNGTAGADARTRDAWDVMSGTAGTKIAVIEFGFDANHPDLGSRPDDWDFVNDGPLPSVPDPVDSHDIRHGTAMAAIAAGKQPQAASTEPSTPHFYGACPDCSLMLLRVAADVWTIEQALTYAHNKGAAVITNSWGFPQGLTMPPSLAAAIEDAASGSVVLFAMDNSFVADCDGHPTGLESVIAVSRSTNRDLADHAGYGNCLSLLAPSAWKDTVPSRGTRWIATADMRGEKGYNNKEAVPSLCPELPDDLDHTRCIIGTSASTALAAGVAGLVRSANTLITPVEVKRLLQDTADKIEPWAAGYRLEDGSSKPGANGLSTHGYGRINALEALRVVAPVAADDKKTGRGGVDVFLRDSALDWGNTSSSTSTGAPPNPRGGVQSVDIKLASSISDPAPTSASFDSFADNATPNPTVGNKVFVRVHNRGPFTATNVTVKLFATIFDRILPTPPTGWSAPLASGGVDATWHSFACSKTGGDTCIVDVPYSGASVGGTGDDQSVIVAFDLPPIPNWDGDHNRLSLLATVESTGAIAGSGPYEDRLPDATAVSTEEIAPKSNNVTYRNYPEDTIEERGTCSTLPDKNWVTSNPSHDVRWAIADTLSSYAWALDDKRADDFAALFATSGTYEVCAGGGDSRVYDASKNEFQRMLGEQFANLAKMQTRHILSNTLLRTRTDNSGHVISVDSRSTMVVTMQHNDTDHIVPSPDYTAEVRATFLPEAGKWKFRTLTIYSDSPQLVLRGR